MKRSAASFLDRLADPSTRRHVLETAICAHALLNPETLRPILAARRDGYRLVLSVAAADVLDVIVINTESGARIALVRWVLYAAIDAGWGRARTIAAVGVARAVAAVQVQDLASLGAPDLVLCLLEAHGHEQSRERMTIAHTSRAA